MGTPAPRRACARARRSTRPATSRRCARCAAAACVPLYWYRCSQRVRLASQCRVDEAACTSLLEDVQRETCPALEAQLANGTRSGALWAQQRRQCGALLTRRAGSGVAEVPNSYMSQLASSEPHVKLISTTARRRPARRLATCGCACTRCRSSRAPSSSCFSGRRACASRGARRRRCRQQRTDGSGGY